MASHIHHDLEKIVLQYPSSNLRGTAAAHLILSSRNAISGLKDNDNSSVLQDAWIRKSHELRVQIDIKIDGKAIGPDVRQRIAAALLHAKMWQQMNLQARPSHEDSDTISIALHSPVEEEPSEDRERTIYDICYQTPPKDIAPPEGVPVLDLDVVKLSLTLRRKVKKQHPPRKKRKTNTTDLLAESEDDEMLLSSQDHDVLPEIDAVHNIVDAVIRLYIVGDLTKMKPIAEGLAVKFLGRPTSLVSAAPMIFSSTALGAMATRFALLPTVAHAFSSSLYARARSLKLRVKLQKLIAPDSSVEEGDRCATSAGEHSKSTSARLWSFLQNRVCDSTRAPKLVGLIPHDPDNQDAHAQQDEDLFATHAPDEEELEDEDDLFMSPRGDGWGQTLRIGEEMLWSEEQEEEDDLFARTADASADVDVEHTLSSPHGLDHDYLGLDHASTLFADDDNSNAEDIGEDLFLFLSQVGLQSTPLSSGSATAGDGSSCAFALNQTLCSTAMSPSCPRLILFDEAEDEEDDLLLDLLLDEGMRED